MKNRSKIQKYWELVETQYRIITEISKLEVVIPQEALDGHWRYTSLTEELEEIELEISTLRSELEPDDYDLLLTECLQ